MKIYKQHKIPAKALAAVLTNAGAELKLEQRETPIPERGEVLIKMAATPINPSDLSTLLGNYPHKKTYPFVPGLEGSGQVIACGDGFLPNFLLGKRVACSPKETGDGCWSEYMLTHAAKCIPVNKKLSDAQAASLVVNPLTAMGLVEKIKHSGNTSFINTAAAGALGKMLIRLAKKENLTPINIVRRAAQVTELKALGAQYVLNSSDANFKNEIKEIFAQLKTKIILDCLSGELSTQLLQWSPENSETILYAALSQEPLIINPFFLVGQGKVVSGFHLGFWLKSKSMLQLLQISKKVQKLILSGMLSSHVNKTYGLNQINEAVINYKNNMTEGKSLIVF